MATYSTSGKLQLALAALQENQQSKAISIITKLKPEAMQLVSELEQVEDNLTMLESSLHSQVKFLSFHIKTLEKKERATIISKSISESIQHTQYKKLQASKWELMKVRNALFTAQKKLAKREKEESSLNGYKLSYNPHTNTPIVELRAYIQNTEIIVETLTKDCLAKENSLNDTAHKISDQKRKLEQQTHDTNYLREKSKTLQSQAKETKGIKLYITQARVLWTLCMKAFENGHTKEEVLSSIAKQAFQLTQQDTKLDIHSLSTSRNLLKYLSFTPHCLLCCTRLLTTQQEAGFTCEHCDSRDITNKVVMEDFSCKEGGVITGSIRVCNIAYDKQVMVRYSQDGWRHTSNQHAQYKHSEGSFDFFQFQLPFDISVSLYLEFAVCYRVAGVEFWDNNDGRNYKIAF